MQNKKDRILLDTDHVTPHYRVRKNRTFPSVRLKRCMSLFLTVVLILSKMDLLSAQNITLVRHFDTWNGGIIRSSDPAGIGYHAPSCHLYIADSEINELPVFVGGQPVRDCR